VRQPLFSVAVFLAIAGLIGASALIGSYQKRDGDAREESAGSSDAAFARMQSAFNKDEVVIAAPGAQIEIEFMRGSTFNLPRYAYLNWLQNAASAVSSYYGKFPVPFLRIKLSSDTGDDIGFATTGYEDGSAIIEIPVGENATVETLDRDWTATHEMTHLAFPLMDHEHKWLAEGQATYVEPLARLRIGKYSAKRVWSDLVKHLPEGLPAADDRGLNHTHTWGRTYWGGALFCLIADVRIRQKTGNKKGLEDAAAAIAANGGNIASDWDAEEALAAGDRAVGTTVLEDLYNEVKDEPHPVNLQLIWAKLGVRRTSSGVEFDNTAPLANIRLAIERGSHA
jgi:hypothetical protein